MAKNFTDERAKALLGGAAKTGKGRPQNPKIQHGDPTRERLPYGYKRSTYHLREDLADRLKNISYTDRIRLQELVNNIIEEAVLRIEKEHQEAGIEILKAPAKEIVYSSAKKED